MTLTLTAVLLGVLAAITAAISLLPWAVLRAVIIITSLASMAPLVFAILMGFGYDPGIQLLTDIGFANLILIGIGCVIVMGLFFQGAVSAGHLPSEEG